MAIDFDPPTVTSCQLLVQIGHDESVLGYRCQGGILLPIHVGVNNVMMIDHRNMIILQPATSTAAAAAAAAGVVALLPAATTIQYLLSINLGPGQMAATCLIIV